jgi:hypothetical protein
MKNRGILENRVVDTSSGRKHGLTYQWRMQPSTASLLLAVASRAWYAEEEQRGGKQATAGQRGISPRLLQLQASHKAMATNECSEEHTIHRR